MNSSLHFFSVSALNPRVAEAELNLFIQQHRVANIEKQWVADGAASFWSLCLTVVDGAGPLPTALRAPGSVVSGKTGPKIDYREVLSAADFTVYAELRNLRASIAAVEGVPVYQLFSNAQLASMVVERVITAGGLRGIEGVGEARVNKYASGFLALLQKSFATPAAAPTEPPAK